MVPSIQVGRRLTLRAVAWQLAAVVVLSAICLVLRPAWALPAAMGGLAVMAGSWLFGRLALGGGASASFGALGRLLAGVVLKWFVVIGVLVATVAAGLSPLPLLIGVLVALVVQMVAMATANK